MTTLVEDPPVQRPAPPEASEPDFARAGIERLRLGLICLALVLAVFAQAAGSTAADTKIDLVVSPWRFLRRAVTLWDPIGGSGQLQNQAYGYLLPIGPLYGLLHSLGLDLWELQRAFEASILCAAFLGCYLLARRLGVDAFWPAVGAGLAYALSPRILAELSSISAELMPTAALPWIVLPLVRAAETGSPRRAAAWSGVALLFAGGVNAAATLAVLPVPALFLLTRSPGPRRRALMGWWTLAVGLACAWWAIPLLQLGRFSPPFLDWIETSSVTTSSTNLLASLRGINHWEAYLGPEVWPGGWILASAAGTIVATTLVASGALVGLSSRGAPHRTFLWSCLVLGTILVTAGHASAIGPPNSAAIRQLLDGPLVPFRNIHKFDPLIRLPLSIGVGLLLWRVHVPARVAVRRRRGGTALLTVPARLLAAMAVVAIGAVAITPVWTNHIVSSQRITTEPSWWARSGAWLHVHSGGARALVVPATGAPHYLWGGTVDNAMQPVAQSPWAVRDSVPLGQAGYVRLLDTIDDELASGAPTPTLAPLLARAGIGFVVVANDLDTQTSSSTPLVYVRATLENSPGFATRAAFGPGVGGSLSDKIVIDGGGTVSRPAVQIYGVQGGATRAGLYPLKDAVTASGSSDALPQLLGRGLGERQAVLFGPDAAGTSTGHRVTTDGIRKREASFSGVAYTSVTMGADQPYQQDRLVHDYLPTRAGPLSAYRYRGIAGVSASSSGADNFAFVNRSPLNGAWSALDPDPTSAWQSTGFSAIGQWLQVDLRRPVRARSVTVSFGVPDSTPAPLPTQVIVTTDTGSRVDPVFPLTVAQRIAVPSTPFRHLRVTVTGVAGKGFGTSVAIRSLELPGVTPSRSLAVPTLANSDVFAFDAPSGYRSPCLALSVGPVCDPIYGGRSQEDSGIDRSFSLAAPTEVQVSGTVRLRPGAALNTLLDAAAPARATASSVGTSDPRRRPGAAIDGDPATAWQAAAGDLRPVLRLRLPAPRSIGGLTLVVPTKNTSVARPVRVSVTAGGARRWVGTVPDDGRLVFRRPVTTDRVSITVLYAVLRTTATSVSLREKLEAAGFADVHLDGVPDSPTPATITVPCGTVSATVDGRTVPLTVSAPLRDVLAGAPVGARSCPSDPIALAAGSHRIGLDANEIAVPASLILTRPGASLSGAAATSSTLHISSWAATHRTAEVDTAEASLLVVHENFNPGWTATLHGRRLRAVQVDGWEQAFVVPAGSHGTVIATFAAQRTFAIGLWVGLLGVLALVALAVLPGRRRRAVGAGHSEPGPIGAARLRPWLAVGMAVVTGAALGGTNGLAIAAGVTLVAGLLGARSGHVLGWSAAGTLVVGALITTHGSGYELVTRQNSATVQALCIGALVAGLLAAAAAERRDRPWTSRRTGRSTRNQDTLATSTDSNSVSTSKTPK